MIPPLVLLTALIHDRNTSAEELLRNPAEVLRGANLDALIHESQELIFRCTREIQRRGPRTPLEELLLVAADYIEEGRLPPISLGRTAAITGIPPQILGSWALASARLQIQGLAPGTIGLIQDELADFLMIRFPLTWGTRGPEYIVADICWKPKFYEEEHETPYADVIERVALSLTQRGRIKLAWGLLSHEYLMTFLEPRLRSMDRLLRTIHRCSNSMHVMTDGVFELAALDHGLLLIKRRDRRISSRVLRHDITFSCIAGVANLPFMARSGPDTILDEMDVEQTRSFALLTDNEILSLNERQTFMQDAIRELELIRNGIHFVEAQTFIPLFLLNYFETQERLGVDDYQELQFYIQRTYHENAGPLFEVPEEDVPEEE